MREATLWLGEFPHRSITIWNVLSTLLLDQLFYLSKILQLKDKTYNTRQLHSEELSETWLRLTKKLQNIPNQRNTCRNFLEILYRALNANTKDLADTITGGAFMSL